MLPDPAPADPRPPQVLFVYYTYTQQTLKIVEAMADVFHRRGYEVQQASIQFTDSRYAKRFSQFPFRHLYRDLFGMIPAQLRGATGEIRIPDNAREGNYDLVCIGSPTWWLKTSVPIRSYLKSDAAGQTLAGKRFAAFVVCRRYWGINLRAVKKLGTAKGGSYLDSAHWAFAGGQLKSLLSLLSYLGTGENRDHYLGVRIPPTNLQPEDLEQAQTFANTLADRLAIGKPA
ncbi:MAG: flavodoxin family protein [Solirubrobacteraceae bacterium]